MCKTIVRVGDIYHADYIPYEGNEWRYIRWYYFADLDAETSPAPRIISLTGPYFVDDPTGIEAAMIETEVVYYPDSVRYRRMTANPSVNTVSD